MVSQKQEKKYKKVAAHKFVRIAEGDLKSGKVLLDAKEGRLENIAFHCQQAIEKSLKAVLIWREIAIPFIHDLSALVAKMPEDLNPPEGYDLSILTQFATVKRYEEGDDDDLDDATLQEIYSIAYRVLVWAKENIK